MPSCKAGSELERRVDVTSSTGGKRSGVRSTWLVVWLGHGRHLERFGVQSPRGHRAREEAPFSSAQAGADPPRERGLGKEASAGGAGEVTVLVSVSVCGDDSVARSFPQALSRAFPTPRSVAGLAFVLMSGLPPGPLLLLPSRILQFDGLGLLPEARRGLFRSAPLPSSPETLISPTPEVPEPCRSPMGRRAHSSTLVSCVCFGGSRCM